MNTVLPKEFNAESLKVEIHPDTNTMGTAAANAVAAYLRQLDSVQDSIRVIFACAPSQNSFLSALTDSGTVGEVPWAKMDVFHMDEYIGLNASQPQSFRSYLQEHLLSKVSVREFFPIPGEGPDPVLECKRYAQLLDEGPIDLICLGIGENGHLAFNDPPVADFSDPELVKIVELEDACRQQQVNDGCFPSFDDVPTHALTLTLPVFRNARRLSCVVPGLLKAQAVKQTIDAPLSTGCPSTLLRSHSNATLYLDPPAASMIG